MKLRCLFSLVLIGCFCLVGRADKLELVAGGATKNDGVPAAEFKLTAPFGIDIDKAGNFYIVELYGHRFHKIDPKGVLTTIGGNGSKGNAGDGGPVKNATFNGMHALAVHPNTGDVYVADTWNNKVRKLDAKTGTITTIAGTGVKGYAGDGGPADQAKFGGIYCVALDPQAENLICTDLDNRRIRKVALKTGTVTTVAGNGQRGVPKDGALAVEAPLVDPRAAIADAAGNIYVLERGGHALRIVDPQGKIRTVVGTGKAGNSGDGGPALEATMNGPKHLCLDKDGSVLIADTENHVVRRYLPKEGKIVRVAGTGKKGTELSADPLKTQLNQPHGVFVHPDGTLYIVDSSNHRVLRIVRE
ncbi:MAG: hypothetical protein AB7K24_15415 [Gemmataceae bacterium]